MHCIGSVSARSTCGEGSWHAGATGPRSCAPMHCPHAGQVQVCTASHGGGTRHACSTFSPTPKCTALTKDKGWLWEGLLEAFHTWKKGPINKNAACQPNSALHAPPAGHCEHVCPRPTWRGLRLSSFRTAGIGCHAPVMPCPTLPPARQCKMFMFHLERDSAIQLLHGTAQLMALHCRRDVESCRP